MLAEEAMDGRTRDRDLMEPPEIGGNPPGSKVILLSEIENLTDHRRRRGARGPLRRSGAIAQAGIAADRLSALPFVVGLSRDAEVAAGVRHRPVPVRRVLQDLGPPGHQPDVL